MTQIEAMKLALEALKWCHGGEPCGTAEAITAIEEALSETQYWSEKYRLIVQKEFEATPPQHTWVGLSDEEIKAMDAGLKSNASFYAGALWAEAKLKEKNT